MGAWSKMMTAPNFHGMHQPPAHFAMDKCMTEKDEKSLGSPPHDDLASFKALQSADELNGASDIDSEMASENDEEVPAIDGENASPGSGKKEKSLDVSHQEILEKLKRQEEEERVEIERELREAQNEALRSTSSDDNHAQDLRLDSSEDSEKEKEKRLTPTQTEIKTQRPPGLLAQHGLMTHKNHSERSESLQKDRDLLHSHLRDTIKSERTLPPPIAPLDFTHPAFLERQFSRPPSTPGSPPSIGLSNGDGLGTHTGGHHWTFEEQFKQLYELSDDPKRKEFLDDLFSFMQKRGTPVNRIPIMAKQPLDLYELFRLVVSKGGLVEVINKKLWREICKGLNLPSSITSAAFTLRTQYMKYLYPYECDKLKLSNPAELQAAIDGNRREGRRPGYGYDFSPMPTMIPPSPHHLNGGLLNGRHPMPHHGEDDGLSSPPPHLRSLAEREHLRAMEAAHQVMEEAKKRLEVHRSAAPPLIPPPIVPFSKDITTSSEGALRNTSPITSKPDIDGPPPPKRLALSPEDLPREVREARERFERFMPPHFAAMPGAHLKITSRNDGRADFDNSLVVSMEVNGIMYQGVLFAQHPPRRL